MLQPIDDMLSEFALVNWTAGCSDKKTAEWTGQLSQQMLTWSQRNTN